MACTLLLSKMRREGRRGVENFRGKFVWEGQKGRGFILEDVLYNGVNFAGGTWETEKIKDGIIAA